LTTDRDGLSRGGRHARAFTRSLRLILIVSRLARRVVSVCQSAWSIPSKPARSQTPLPTMFLDGDKICRARTGTDTRAENWAATLLLVCTIAPTQHQTRWELYDSKYWRQLST